MIRASILLALPFVFALAGCGDDTSGAGGGGGATSSSAETSASTGEGGDAATTSQGTGGAPGTGGGDNLAEEFANACSDACDSFRDIAEGLGCGSALDTCIADECSGFAQPCAAEQIAVMNCYVAEADDASCFCEGPDEDADFECEDICLEESEALDTCQGD